MKIYISPANHTKPYFVSGNNEKQHMEIVGKKVCEILGSYDCDVFYPTVFYQPGINGSYVGRPAEAKKLGADVYVAIHSNAAAQMGAYATGAVGFYHPDSADGKRLAKAMQERLDDACPIKSNRYDKILDGMKFISGGLGEIREPQKLGMTSVLIEVNFHSYESTCRWIMSNHNVIAQQIADALVNVYALKKRTPVAETKPAEKVPVAPAPEQTAIKAGDSVRIKPGAVYGGANVAGVTGKAIPAAQIGKVHTVGKIQKINGADQALLSGINSWVAVAWLDKA